MEDKSFTHVEKPVIIPEGWETKMLRRRILVVEDDDDIRRFNAEALASSGYHVEAAVDGASGWEALNANRYDLLITDNNMPNLSGVELIKKLNAARMAVPVILASGLEHPHEVAELRLAATLPKPFTLDELLGTVKKVLDEAGGGAWQAPASNGPPVEPWET
jgi:two-component system, chemotaxis family, chemotaxis protein CheY